jgi:oligopeptide transport system permease protein
MDKKDEKKLSKDLFEHIGMDAEKGEQLGRKEVSYWKDSWRRLKKNKAAIVGLVAILFIGIMSLVGPHINKYDYDTADYDATKMPPRVQGIENIEWLNWLGMNGERTVEVEGYSGEDAFERGLAAYEVPEEYATYEVVREYDDTREKAEDQYAKIEMTFNDYVARGYEDSYFWFGTDALGRDIFTRTWQGTQISLYIGILAAAIDMLIGVAYGGISAYYGGRVDNYMQRFLEVLVGIPNLVVVILMIIILDPGILAITIAITMTGWIGMARIIRGQILKLKSQEFVLASRTLGAKDSYIIRRHLVPNTTGMIIINSCFTIPAAIFFEAFLSFIGLGLQPPIASLGVLISDAFNSYQVYPYMLWYPAIVLSILMIGFNVLADGLRDALDPKMRD